jgi:hypothetical protein
MSPLTPLRNENRIPEAKLPSSLAEVSMRCRIELISAIESPIDGACSLRQFTSINKRDMSLWRKEASNRLPELQQSIASASIKTPSDLWMELRLRFDQLCRQEPPPIELLSRIWQYARWSDEHPAEDVQFAVEAHFFERIEDTRLYRTVLPKFMSPKEYETICGLRSPTEQKNKQ